MTDTQWTIYLKQVETLVGVGIHAHEKEPQRVLVDVEIRGNYAARPQMIEECISYDFVYDYITKQWPKRAHTPLLEQLAVGLLDMIFAQDMRVNYAKVGVFKPDIFANASVVGVETERRRNA